MNAKYLTATLTKTPTDGSGTFEAIVYDPAAGDVDGIVITAEGMRRAVAMFHRRGRNLVLRWAHDKEDPDSALGTINDVRMSDGKLVVRGALDLQNGKSMRIYEGMLTGRINEFSISWASPPGGSHERDGLMFVDDMELLEVSVVAVGANRGTRLLAVKSAPPQPSASEAKSRHQRWLFHNEKEQIVIDLLEKYGDMPVMREALGMWLAGLTDDEWCEEYAERHREDARWLAEWVASGKYLMASASEPAAPLGTKHVPEAIEPKTGLTAALEARIAAAGKEAGAELMAGREGRSRAADSCRPRGRSSRSPSEGVCGRLPHGARGRRTEARSR